MAKHDDSDGSSRKHSDDKDRKKHKKEGKKHKRDKSEKKKHDKKHKKQKLDKHSRPSIEIASNVPSDIASVLSNTAFENPPCLAKNISDKDQSNEIVESPVPKLAEGRLEEVR
jgi:ABC-type Zn2+ transport system substrate-binding protein/surface adhesin